MPDKHGFDHLPRRGQIELRCIEEGCEFGGWMHEVNEASRRRHAKQHRREQEERLRRDQLANLREARRLKRQAERENRIAYG